MCVSIRALLVHHFVFWVSLSFSLPLVRCSASEMYSVLCEDESPIMSEGNFEDMFKTGNVLGKGSRATVFR